LVEFHTVGASAGGFLLRKQLYTCGMNKLLTLCLVVKDGRVLLGMKKRGFGAGRWNGFGGKVQEGETIADAAIREMKEESGVDVRNLEEVGMLEFVFPDNSQIHEVHIYTTTQFEGEPAESEEMRPRWFAFGEVPYEDMWPDDQFWLPKVLVGKKIQGRFEFGPDDSIIAQHLEEI
jgi:8-oxo-dGTP diphosphatase/2-hydroxy-dATP diphosphatase